MKFYSPVIFLFFAATSSPAQKPEPIDTAIVSKMQREGTKNSQVMSILSMLTDVSGPRLTNSPGFFKSAEYARSTFNNWQLDNVHIDTWDQLFGRGWHIKKFRLESTFPYYYPVSAYPKGWSHGLKDAVEAEVIYLDIKKEEDLRKFKGKLRGKLVLFSLPATVGLGWKPNASRLTDSTLLTLENAPAGEAYTGRRLPRPGEPQRLAYLKYKLCEEEGAVALLEASMKMQDGIIMTNATHFPYPVETPYHERAQPHSVNAPKTLPQIVVSAEHYNRMVRQIEHGVTVKLRLEMNVEFGEPKPGINVLAEITGTDLRDEVVMIGAHLDSWHAATGTTDNASGVAVMMEAMRILTKVGVKPRRTIRIALWGGEEQGLLGSRNYAARKIGVRVDKMYPYDSIVLKPEGAKLSLYLNSDLGSGKFRGVYLQGNEKARTIFRQWIKPFEKSGTATLTGKNITGTDHLTFDALGIPSFQFIQDPLEYGTTTYHSNMDVYEKASEQDLKHNAVVVAAFAWFGAMRDEPFPKR